MRLNKRKRNKSFCKTDNKCTEISQLNNTSVKEMVLQPSVAQLSPNHFQHSNDNMGRKFFAGSRFSEAPNPSLLPKPPLHWMCANDSGIDPMDRLQTLTTNGINNHNINGSSFISSETKRDKSDDNLIELKLLQILEASSIVSTSLSYENTRLLVKK